MLSSGWPRFPEDGPSRVDLESDIACQPAAESSPGRDGSPNQNSLGHQEQRVHQQQCPEGRLWQFPQRWSLLQWGAGTRRRRCAASGADRLGVTVQRRAAPGLSGTPHVAVDVGHAAACAAHRVPMPIHHSITALWRTQPVPVSVSHTAAVWCRADGVAIAVLNTARLGRPEVQQRECQGKKGDRTERYGHERSEQRDSAW